MQQTLNIEVVETKPVKKPRIKRERVKRALALQHEFYLERSTP